MSLILSYIKLPPYFTAVFVPTIVAKPKAGFLRSALKNKFFAVVFPYTGFNLPESFNNPAAKAISVPITPTSVSNLFGSV